MDKDEVIDKLMELHAKDLAHRDALLADDRRKRRELLAAMMLVPDDEETYAGEAYHALERADAIMRLSGEGES